MIDIAKLRDETPGCSEVLHFNNAGSSLMPAPVHDAMMRHIEMEYLYGGAEAERRSQAAIQGFYPAFAKLLNADPEEIAYVENATRGWDMAFYGIPFKEGDRIITHESEYASNYLAFLQIRKRVGIEIDLVPSDPTGQIDVDALKQVIRPQTRAIAITHIPTQGGLVNPAEEVGRFARDHGLIYVLDGCQSVGQVDIDVKKIGCHILTGSGRKFLRGPRGTGFLYVSNEIIGQLEPPFVDLHSATWTGEDEYEFFQTARKFENYESNVAGKVGITAAVEYALNVGMPEIENRIALLGHRMREMLAELPKVTVHDRGERKGGIVTFTIDGFESAEVAERLRQVGCNVSVSNVEFARLDLGRRGTGPVVRASVHYFNTDEEIDKFVSMVSAF